jgi:sugar phosphate isomerase/epimerase
LDTLLGDQLPATIEYNQILGNKYLIVPGLPGERTSTTSAWLETAKIFNEIAEQVAEHGMQTGYHNHSAEFKKMDGEYPWDTFFGNTCKEVVMQLDTGNALHAEVDVAPFIERYPGRAQTVHLKEHSSTNSKALIGEGDVNWQEIFKLCESIGSTEWYIVEQESYAFSPLECVDICLKNLKKMGK